MQPCSKCLNQVGDEAVLLKNGLYMCPTCYQRAYPADKNNGSSSSPQRFYVSIEGVLAVLLTIGGMYGCYVLYNHHVESERTEALERKQAQEAADKRYEENRIMAEAEQKKNDADRVAREIKRDAERKAQRAAELADAEARNKRYDARRLADEKLMKDQQIKREMEARAQALERERLDALDKANSLASDSKKRAAELAELTRTCAEAEKIVAHDEAEKALKQKSYSIHKVIFDSKKATLLTMLEQYKPKEKWKDKIWEREWYATDFDVKTKVVGNTVITQESDAPKIVSQFNKAASEANANYIAMNADKLDLDRLTTEITDSQARRADAIKRIAELKAADGDAAPNAPVATVPPPLPGTVPAKPVTDAAPAQIRKPGFKTIYKKDGTTLQAQSTIKMDDELRYRDEKGNWIILKANEVDKIEVNEK